MRQDDRAPFDRALHGARVAAYAPGEFVGQESFMTAGEIRALAVQAGIAPGVSVLDVCCGIAGPGRFLTRELGCDYLGVDASASAVAIARERASDLPCRFAVAQIPPLPAGSFDVVLLLETMLAFADKDALAGGIGAALRPGGRFAFTLEEGAPLTAAERAAMPDADTVWLTPLDALTATLERAGLAITWQEDHSRAHRATAQALADAFAADADAIAARIGRVALDDLLAAHRRWIEWLDTGRVRKFALVAERRSAGARDAFEDPGRKGHVPRMPDVSVLERPGVDRAAVAHQVTEARLAQFDGRPLVQGLQPRRDHRVVEHPAEPLLVGDVALDVERKRIAVRQHPAE
jgi:SAM-dependent methyltransferase